MEYKELTPCIDACLECATLCDHCAVTSLKHEATTDVNRVRNSIRLNMECATICYAAAELMSTGSDRSTEICRLCAEVCEACAAECLKLDGEHCRQCAEACNACAEQCRKVSQLTMSAIF
jgi:hypothetical protein